MLSQDKYNHTNLPKVTIRSLQFSNGFTKYRSLISFLKITYFQVVHRAAGQEVLPTGAKLEKSC